MYSLSRKKNPPPQQQNYGQGYNQYGNNMYNNQPGYNQQGFSNNQGYNPQGNNPQGYGYNNNNYGQNYPNQGGFNNCINLFIKTKIQEWTTDKITIQIQYITLNPINSGRIRCIVPSRISKIIIHTADQLVHNDNCSNYTLTFSSTSYHLIFDYTIF